MYEVRVEAKFEAGHKRGPDGEIHSLHHHAWKVAAYARSHDLDHIGLVIDFRVLRTVVDEVLGMLDQRVLEDVDTRAAVLQQRRKLRVRRGGHLLQDGGQRER